MKRTFAAVILAAIAAFSQEPSNESFTFSRFSAIHSGETPSALIIGESGKPALTISSKGVVTFGEGVSPSDAALKFAEAIGSIWPAMCAEREREASFLLAQSTTSSHKAPVPHKKADTPAGPTALEAMVADKEKSDAELARRRVEAENEVLKKQLAVAKAELAKAKAKK